MRASYLMVCRLLAASGYGTSELKEFVEQVLRSGPGAFLSTVNELRHRDTYSLRERASGNPPADKRSEPPIDSAAKISRLLLREAGFPRKVAIEVLTGELRQRYPSQQIPAESRKGFDNWIRRLSQQFPEKDLLFLATAIRNRVVHDAPTDWRLR